jgi:anti-sigma regulatory factor (Ser/Thr protein kinase)
MTDSTQPFTHQALLYRSDQEYLVGTLAFLREGLAAGEPVLAAAPWPRLAMIRDELGREARRVRFIDMAMAGRNPGWIIPGILRMFADGYLHSGTRVWMLSEGTWPGRSAMEYPACIQHEALVNLAFAGRPATVLCPYDAARFSPAILADAATTHPWLVDAKGERLSRAYAPERILRTYNLPMESPPDTPTLDFHLGNVASARAFAGTLAVRSGLPAGRVSDLELAIGELAANSIRYGGGRGTIGVWTSDGHIICEIRDGGHLTDPLAGRRPVDLTMDGGRGLLLANQLADLVRIHSTPRGTTVRLFYSKSS